MERQYWEGSEVHCGMDHMYPVMQVITLSTKTFSNNMRNRVNKEVDYITFLRILLHKKGDENQVYAN